MTRLSQLNGSCHGSPRHDYSFFFNYYYYIYFFLKKKKRRRRRNEISLTVINILFSLSFLGLLTLLSSFFFLLRFFFFFPRDTTRDERERSRNWERVGWELRDETERSRETGGRRNPIVEDPTSGSTATILAKQSWFSVISPVDFLGKILKVSNFVNLVLSCDD
jgi:hypothetical protein